MSYWQPLQKLFASKLPPGSGHWPTHLLSGKWEEQLGKEVGERIILVPSAAWKMKRWPLEHFKELIRLLPHKKFFVLGGNRDHFCRDLETLSPRRVMNLAGKLDLKDSCSLVARAPLVISGDTGLIHVADLAGTKGIALMGPTAFGFCTYPHISTLEVDLSCRPCTKDGRGKCSQKVYQKCMVDITPKQVAQRAEQLLSS